MRDADLERPLPSSPDSERAILGSILLDPRLMDEAISTLRPEDFYVRSNQKVFAAMMELHSQHAEINSTLVTETLRRFGEPEGVANVATVSSLAFGLPHVTRLAPYTNILREKSALRWIAKEGDRLKSVALDEQDEAQAILAGATERFSAMREVSANGHAGGPLSEIGRQVEDHLYIIKAGLNPSIPTGFERLDHLTGGGIKPGELWGIGALSSRGKTSLLAQILMHVASRRELGKEAGVVLFSLEMTSLLIGLRILAGATSIPINRIKTGMPEAELNSMLAAVREAFDLPLWIYTDCSSVSDIHARIKTLKRKHPIQVVGIDYYGKLSGYGRGRDRYENRTQELKFIANYLQQEIAIREEVGLVVPAQFNRSAWGAKAEAGAGNIDGGEAYFQACDLFAVLNTEKAKKVGDVMAPASLAIHKQRNGPTAMGNEAIKLDFHRDRMMFFPRVEDLGEEVPDQPKENVYL